MKRLPWFTKLAYGFGDSGLSATSTIISFFFLYYLTDVAGLRPALAGAVVLAGRLYDAITDPLEGYLSDRTRSRWGRRRPYFLFGAIPFGLTFFLMFAAPALPHPTWVTAFAAVAYILHMTAFTGIAVPYTALTAELTDDYDERTSLTAYRMAFSILIGLAAAALPWVIVGGFDQARTGFAVMAAIFGAFSVLPPLAVFFACREDAGPRPPARPEPGRAGVRDFVRGMLLTLENRPFRFALGIYLVTWMAIDVVAAGLNYFLVYVMDLADQAFIVLGLLFVTAALCLPLWVWVSRRFSKKAAFVAGMSFMAVVLLGVAYLEPGQTTLVFVLAALAGVGLSTAHVIPWALVPDCIEYDELRTGRRREGQHYGFMTFAHKAASSAAIFGAGLALELSGYIGGAPAQAESALTAIRWLIGPVPGVFIVLAMLLILRYPVSRAEHARLVTELEHRREAAETAVGAEVAAARE